MKEAYFKYVLLIGIVAFGVVSVTEAEDDCKVATDECDEGMKKSNNISDAEIERIKREKENSTLSKKDNDRFCKFTNDIQLCYDDVSFSCPNDEYLTNKTKEVDAEAKLFKCDDVIAKNCPLKAQRCEEQTINSSKIEKVRWNLIKSDATRRKYLIAQIENNLGCDIFIGLKVCFQSINKKCINDPIYQEILNVMLDLHKILYCDGRITDCDYLLNKCKNETMDVALQQEVENIIWTPTETDNSGIITKFGKDRGCKFVKNFRHCHEKSKGGKCERDDEYFRPILNVTDLTEAQFNCGVCADLRDKCKLRGISESGLTNNEIQEIFDATDTELRDRQNYYQNLFSIMGKRGCSFMKVFNDCRAENKNQCGDNDPYFQPISDLTETVYVNLHCGCASAFASLFLILTSILLIFYQRTS